MIQVKENLLKGYSGTYKVEAKNNGVASDNYNYKEIAIPDTLEENQKYTLCFKLKQINGSGEFSINIYNKGNTKSAGGAKLQVDDKRMYFDFIYRTGITENILIYNDISGQTRGVGAEIKDMILLEGYYEKTDEETVYLPHKEEVKPYNQAIFPIGGVRSKRCIQSRPKGCALC